SHDIALAVAYLHTKRILHRDLSSNNVLLNPGCQAKVTDFGMSQVADSNHSMTRSQVTQCPGTLAYMPPEALLPKPRYSEKLDSFSMGVLMIQTITRKFPAPTEAHITREDPESSTGIVYIPVSEVERRKADISGISTMHPLLSIAKCCLKDKYQERPNASQICQSLADLKTTVAYKVSTTETSDSTMEEASVEQPIKEQCENQPQIKRPQLHETAERGDVEAVKRLLATSSVKINSTTKQGETALLLASWKGHEAVVRLLIEAHASINLKDKDGLTPLYWASFKGHVAIVRLLIQWKADVNACDKKGFSPVLVASQKGHESVVELLIGAGANIHLGTSESDDTPLGIAAKNGHIGIVRKLMNAGANIHHPNKAGLTPLILAIIGGNAEAVKFLIQKKCDLGISKKVIGRFM
ncbi:Ankyrin repeat and protein kinase domain-containing protein 1, partial [Geodia barretti]